MRMRALQNLELPNLRVAQCEWVEQVVKLSVIIQNLIPPLILLFVSHILNAICNLQL